MAGIPSLVAGINAYTTRAIPSEIQDLVFFGTPVLKRLLAQNVKDYEGGRNITIPIMYRPVPAGPMSNAQTVDVTIVQTETAFSINPKTYWANISLSAIDLGINYGPQAALSVVETKFANAGESLSNVIGQELYPSGLNQSGVSSILGTDTGPLSLDGFAQWISQPAICPTVGGLARSSLTSSSSVGFGNSYVNNINGVTSTNDIYNAIAQTWVSPTASVDMLTANPTTWMLYHNRVAPLQRAGTDEKVGDFGFPSLRFSTADFVADPMAPVGTVWGFCTRFLQLWLHVDPAFRFGTTGFKSAAPIIDFAAQIVVMLNFSYPNPRVGFLLYGITG